MSAILACARKLLAAAGDNIFRAIATHNAQTLATIYHLAGAISRYRRLRVPVSALLGRRRSYEEVVAKDKLDRAVPYLCPGKDHETLLAYLVIARLPRKWCQSSFVSIVSGTVFRSKKLTSGRRSRRQKNHPGSPPGSEPSADSSPTNESLSRPCQLARLDDRPKRCWRTCPEEY